MLIYAYIKCLRIFLLRGEDRKCLFMPFLSRTSDSRLNHLSSNWDYYANVLHTFIRPRLKRLVPFGILKPTAREQRQQHNLHPDSVPRNLLIFSRAAFFLLLVTRRDTDTARRSPAVTGQISAAFLLERASRASSSSRKEAQLYVCIRTYTRKRDNLVVVVYACTHTFFSAAWIIITVLLPYY